MRKEIMIHFFHGYYDMLCQEMGVKLKPTNWPIAWIATCLTVWIASLTNEEKNRHLSWEF